MKQSNNGAAPLKTTVSLRVSRWNPERDTNPFFREYAIERGDDTSVLAALEYIFKNIDCTLGFRYSCRHGVCGSCAMMINGKPKLACHTFLRDYETVVTVEPLRGFAVLRDLIVDIEPLFDKLKQVMAHIIVEDAEKENARDHRQSPEELERIDPYSSCVLCGICYAACPIFIENPDYMGPAALTSGYRYMKDSRDQGMHRRINIITEKNGVFSCAANEGCSRSCPKGIKNAEAIQKMKILAVRKKFGIL